MEFSICLFVSDHTTAISAAQSWLNDEEPSVELNSVEFTNISEFEIEELAGHVVVAVHASGVICEMDDVDLDFENLLALNEDIAQAFFDLEEEQFEDVAAAWTKSDGFEGDEAAALDALRQIVELARAAVASEHGIYCYVA